MARSDRKPIREALPGGLTVRDLEDRLRTELTATFATTSDQYLWLRDLTDEWVVYELEYGTNAGCYQITYTIDDEGNVALGDPEEVEQKTVYEVKEATDTLVGRILEAKGTDEKTGERIYQVEILRYGPSLNGRRYPEAVMRTAASLYEGAKAFDHHRTDEDLVTSTVEGIVGYYRDVKPGEQALEGELHLLPSASRVTEALDASLALQAQGLEPLIGISHDIYASFKPVVENGRQVQEATQVQSVNSVDIVAQPAAGGRATRMVAGGPGTAEDPEEEETMTPEQLQKLIDSATPEQKAAIAAGLGVQPPAEPTPEEKNPAEPDPAAPKEPALVGAATESVTARDSVMGRFLVKQAVTEANLDVRIVETVAKHLPTRFTEADLKRQIDHARSFASEFEKAGLAPTVTQVTKEERDRKLESLDAMLAGDYRKGYKSFKHAFMDISGYDVRKAFDPTGEDFNRAVLRESRGAMAYDSSRRAVDSLRTVESIATSTWAEILGDSLTRRMVAEYGLAQLSEWRKIISSIVPVNDFRTQRIDRMGGYGTLPGVNQGAPYQPLTSPTDEEVTYTITKRGGTEDLTLEAIANDDLRAVQRIPKKLGRAGAQTLFRFVFDFLAGNGNVYDGSALFVAGHSNTDAGSALTATTLATGRRKMRKQTAYGDSSEVLGFTPAILVVPSDLEGTGFELTKSAVAITTNKDATVPNIHQGLELIVIDYYSDADDWFLVADPDLCPTIELGFYQGREDPELFVQDDPNTGAVFNSDKVTWKIRHIYSGAVLDYRGFYRGQG
jgi:hypothetical protein